MAEAARELSGRQRKGAQSSLDDAGEGLQPLQVTSARLLRRLEIPSRPPRHSHNRHAVYNTKWL